MFNTSFTYLKSLEVARELAAARAHTAHLSGSVKQRRAWLKRNLSVKLLARLQTLLIVTPGRDMG